MGVCDELGTSSFADTLDQSRVELQEAVQLQLNGVERTTGIRGYLADNEVTIRPVNQPERAGFTVAAGNDLWSAS